MYYKRQVTNYNQLSFKNEQFDSIILLEFKIGNDKKYKIVKIYNLIANAKELKVRHLLHIPKKPFILLISINSY